MDLPVIVGGQPLTLVPMPQVPGLRSVEFNIFDGVATIRSPFTGKMQAQQWYGGDMWSGKAELPPLAQGDADEWISFLEALRGKANAFQMGDPMKTAPRGSGSGAPMVDNSLNGGNPPGSEFLGTRGWTPNAAGVLLPGDYMQVGWRLYRVLDIVNADANGQAVISISPSLREQPQNNGTNARWLVASGQCAKTKSVTLGGYAVGAMWGSFTAPVVPHDAVILGIYPVIIASAVEDICYQMISYGEDLQFTNGPAGGAELSLPSPPYNPSDPEKYGTFSSTELYDLGGGSLSLPPGVGIGTDPSALAGQNLMICLVSSLDQWPLTDSITATGVGFAVYYTSATPVTEALMPPPYPVPAGQGLAWSVPLAAGVGFDPSVGNATAAPATDNGAITLYGPKGIWRLQKNTRSFETSASERVTPLSFPFQEFR